MRPIGDKGYSPKGAPGQPKKLKSRIGGGLYNAYSPPIRTDRVGTNLQAKAGQITEQEESADVSASREEGSRTKESTAAKNALRELDNDQIKQRWAELNAS